MNKKGLEFILQEGEGQFIEFKESFDPKNLAKEIVAFVNSQGGRVFLGVDDQGRVKGVQATNKLKSQIQDLARNCDPPIHVRLEEIGNVLIIEVDEGINKPYKCSAGFFLRQGSSSQKLSTDEIRDFFNKEGKILFDEGINDDFSFEEGFNKSKFEDFVKRARLSRTISDEDILKNIGVLTKNGKFRNAGVLFFCDNIEKFFRHAIVTCVLYKGTDKYKIIDRKDFTEDAISNYNGTMAFLMRNLRLEYEIKAGPREEILEIPQEALREAIVNAMAHRDYNEKGANVQIDIFDDRVEISNPGGLVPAIKREDFGKKSLSRNPLLFSLFKSADLVEKIGSGIGRMRNAMKKAGLPAPKFEFSSFFTVTFQRPFVSQKSSQKSSQKILVLIQGDNKITIDELSRELNITDRGVKKIIFKLKKEGKIRRIGSDKGGHWEIIKGKDNINDEKEVKNE